MKKIYFASALILVFLGALVIDWNIRESSPHQEGVANMIQSRNDDILELEIGCPSNSNYIPPQNPIPKGGGSAKNRKSPGNGGKKTVVDVDPKTPGRSKENLDQKEGYIIHIVQKGDTVSEIAQTYLSASRTDEILKLNNITDPRTVRPGTKLKIPKE